VGERIKAWNATQDPAWRSERARKAANAMHAQGKTNTGPASAAAPHDPVHMAYLARLRWAKR
jgi:hypothetical protein